MVESGIGRRDDTFHVVVVVDRMGMGMVVVNCRRVHGWEKGAMGPSNYRLQRVALKSCSGVLFL